MPVMISFSWAIVNEKNDHRQPIPRIRSLGHVSLATSCDAFDEYRMHGCITVHVFNMLFSRPWLTLVPIHVNLH